MSGAYVFQGATGDDLHAMAPLLAGQLSHGKESVNHYTVSEHTLLGCVSRDKFRQGFMPRYFHLEGMWGVMLGELHESELVKRRRREFGHDLCNLELLARLYRERLLVEDLPQLNGAFFVLLWHPRSRTLVAANDRYGLYPMYWAHSEHRFCLASRVLCSVLSGTVHGDWDPAGVSQFVTTDDYAGETTLIKNVSSFPQATVLVKRDDQLTWTRYWQYDYSADVAPGQMTETARELGERLQQAVERQSASAKRIGVTLSGGLDSRCLVAAAKANGIPTQTFTWAVPGAYDREFAAKVAETYGTQHHDCDYALDNFASRFDEGMRLTEGLIDYFDCHMLAHVDILDEHADVILNGYAGDLILGGSYLRSAWMKPLSKDDLAKRLFAWRNTLLAESHLEHALADPEAVTETDKPSARLRALLEGIDSPTTGDTVDRLFLENRVRRVTSMGTVIMRRNVESAAPFFDYELVDLILKVPPQMRAEHRIYLAMMQECFPEALRLPWQRTLLPAGSPPWMAVGAKGLLKVAGKLERHVGWPRIASKLSPVNFAAWLRGPLRPWMESIINEPHPAANEVLNSSFCKTMWQEHLAGKDRTRMLGVLAAIRGFSQTLRQARAKTPAVSVLPLQLWPPERPATRGSSLEL